MCTQLAEGRDENKTALASVSNLAVRHRCRIHYSGGHLSECLSGRQLSGSKELRGTTRLIEFGMYVLHHLYAFSGKLVEARAGTQCSTCSLVTLRCSAS
jgi:hypothetical protein